VGTTLTDRKSISPLPICILSQEGTMSKEKIQITGSMQEAIGFVRSDSFQVMYRSSNAPSWMIEAADAIIAAPDDRLERYARGIERWGAQALVEFTGSAERIAIPFSGGYDSTAITAMVLKNMDSFPNLQEVVLVTAVTGLVDTGGDNPVHQAERLSNYYGMPIRHGFVDTYSLTRQHVIDTAVQDAQELGFPGICSSCKDVMDVAIAHALNKEGISTVIWGYNSYQRNLAWAEQHEAQRQAVFEYHGRFYPHMRISSPLYDAIRFPPDPVLLFGALGLNPQNPSGEARCLARGMNGQEINPQRLYDFTVNKLTQITEEKIEAEIVWHRPKIPSFVREMKDIREDSRVMSGVMDEGRHEVHRQEVFGYNE
jgi:hypothetical protein